jgi:hypothetical protein
MAAMARASGDDASSLEDDGDGDAAHHPLPVPRTLMDFKAARGVAAAGVASWRPSLHWSFPQSWRRTARWLRLLCTGKGRGAPGARCFFLGIPPGVLRFMLGFCGRGHFARLEGDASLLSSSSLRILPRMTIATLDMALRKSEALTVGLS